MHIAVAEEIDGAAIAAVSAVRPAGRLSLERLKTVHAVSAVSGLDGDLDPIGKWFVVHADSITEFLWKIKRNAGASPREGH